MTTLTKLFCHFDCTDFPRHFFISEVKTCLPDPCNNGGTCETKGNSHKCVCPQPYSGVFCDKSK